MVSCLAWLSWSLLSLAAAALSVEDLLAPQAIVEKLAGDMGFLEGPVWIPDAEKLVFTDIPRSRLMEWSSAGGLKVFRENSKQSNGQTLDSKGRPDEKYLYVADTGMFTNGPPNPNLLECQLPAGIMAFEVTADRGLVRQWRTETLSDGMRVDVKGHIYSTSSERITMLLPTGKMIGTIGVPESPANCAFGGSDFKALFITAQTGLYSIQLLNAGVETKASSDNEEL